MKRIFGIAAALGLLLAGAARAQTISNLPPAVQPFNGSELMAVDQTNNGATYTYRAPLGYAAYMRTPAVTYAVLTTTIDPQPAAGDRAFITDNASACTFGTAATGGGATKCPVVYNGSAWVGG